MKWFFECSAKCLGLVWGYALSAYAPLQCRHSLVCKKLHAENYLSIHHGGSLNNILKYKNMYQCTKQSPLNCNGTASQVKFKWEFKEGETFLENCIMHIILWESKRHFYRKSGDQDTV